MGYTFVSEACTVSKAMFVAAAAELRYPAPVAEGAWGIATKHHGIEADGDLAPWQLEEFRTYVGGMDPRSDEMRVWLCTAGLLLRTVKL